VPGSNLLKAPQLEMDSANLEVPDGLVVDTLFVAKISGVSAEAGVAVASVSRDSAGLMTCEEIPSGKERRSCTHGLVKTCTGLVSVWGSGGCAAMPTNGDPSSDVDPKPVVDDPDSKPRVVADIALSRSISRNVNGKDGALIELSSTVLTTTCTGFGWNEWCLVSMQLAPLGTAYPGPTATAWDPPRTSSCARTRGALPSDSCLCGGLCLDGPMLARGTGAEACPNGGDDDLWGAPRRERDANLKASLCIANTVAIGVVEPGRARGVNGNSPDTRAPPGGTTMEAYVTRGVPSSPSRSGPGTETEAGVNVKVASLGAPCLVHSPLSNSRNWGTRGRCC